MRIIETSRQIGQAVKNVQRLRYIIGVFAKFGFADIVERTNLGRFIPARFKSFNQNQSDKSTAERLRLAFEELGPAFVKLGQLLSSRPDIMPEAFIQELVQLQDHVQPIPFADLKVVIEKELGKKTEEIFFGVSEQPLAAGSIGQVHDAVLLDGTSVVIKIQRPGIDKIIDNDISLLAFIASMLEKYIPESKVFGPKVIVDEFLRSLSYELDYKVEANNMRKMAQNLRSIPEIIIPKVYGEYSSSKVLVLEKLIGLRVNDVAKLDEAGVDRKAIVALGAKAFFKSVMIDGLFHGDLHGGNLFVLPENKLGLVDFGIVGRLSDRSRDMLANMVMSLVTEDFENLCYQYAELGAAGASIDFESFHREVRNTLAPYMGLSLAEVNAGKVLIEATKIATKYQIKVPGEWMIVFKAILTMEGMGRVLDPDFDLMSAGQEMIGDLVKNQYSPQRLSKDLTWLLKDVSGIAHEFPRQIRWAMRRFASNDFALEFKSQELQEIKNQFEVHSRKVSSSVIVAGLFVASSLSLSHMDGHKIGQYPVLAVIYFVVGLFYLIRNVLK